MVWIQYRIVDGTEMEKIKDPPYIPREEERVVFNGKEYFVEDITWFPKLDLIVIEIMQ